MNNTEKFFLRRKLDTFFIKINNLDQVDYVYERDKKDDVFNEDDDIFTNLCTELSKPFLKISKKGDLNQKRNAIRRSSNTKAFGDDSNEIRNLNIIQSSLMRISGFMDFCLFNGIDEETIKSCSPYLTLKNYKSGEYIFKTGDKCDDFYCILKGKVSIRINNFRNKFKEIDKENLIYNEELIEEIRQYQRNNTHRLSYLQRDEGFTLDKVLESIKKDYSEIERFVLYEGKCFGDWGIIYNQKRSASALAIEDTYLICLPKQIFIDCFSNFVMKAENERRKFLLSKIPSFGKSGISSFYYKRLIVECPKRNELIYSENSEGNEIFLIFEGQFLLDRKLSKSKNIIMNTEEKEEKIIKTFSKILTKGSFAGLEVLFNNSKRYEFSLKSLNNYNVIFRIKVDDFPELKDQLIIDLKEIYMKIKKNLQKINRNKYNIENDENSKLPQLNEKYIRIKRRNINNIERIPDRANNQLPNTPDKPYNKFVNKGYNQIDLESNNNAYKHNVYQKDEILKKDNLSNCASKGRLFYEKNYNVIEKNLNNMNNVNLKNVISPNDFINKTPNSSHKFSKRNTLNGFYSDSTSKRISYINVESNKFKTIDDLSNKYQNNNKFYNTNYLNKVENYKLVNRKSMYNPGDNLNNYEADKFKRFSMSINPSKNTNLERILSKFRKNFSNIENGRIQNLQNAYGELNQQKFNWQEYIKSSNFKIQSLNNFDTERKLNETKTITNSYTISKKIIIIDSEKKKIF